jgi:hypothetical protein
LNPTTDSLHPEDGEILSNLLLSGTSRRRSEDLLFKHYHYFVREGMAKYPLKEEESWMLIVKQFLSCIRGIRDGRFEADPP